MKSRFLFELLLLCFAAIFTGCTRDTPPPADRSNMPEEVRIEEEKWEAMTKQNAANREAASQKKH